VKNEIDSLMLLLNSNGIVYDRDFREKLLEFTDFFLTTSKTLNLTAIKEPHEVMIKHYFDSLYPLKFGYIGQSSRVIDIGCGGGFPSLPIKLARPGLNMIQLDSLKKRLVFLDNAHSMLGLENIATLHARAEEAGRMTQLRDSFDVAVSRAVASLNLLCEYCMPFVKPGGVFLAYKGLPDKDEIDAAMPAISKLSGELEDVLQYELPENMGTRTLVVIRKIKPTHPMYPRSSKTMSKNPII